MTKGGLILLVALAAVPAAGQSLQVSVTAGGSSAAVTPAGSVALTAGDLGQPVLAIVTVRYAGTTTATVSGVSVTGTSEMTLLLAPAFPVTLNPNGSISFTVQYLPSTGNSVAAQVSIAFLENNQASTFPFVLTGTSPRLTVSYFLAPNGALTDLNSGDRITFPGTNVGSSNTVVVQVVNRGSAAGALQTVTLSGAAFQLTGSAAPIQLPPGAQTAFNVVFTPQAAGGNQGVLVLGLTKSNASFTLIGNGTTPGLTASYTLADGNAHPLPDASIITFPSVDINGTTTATIEIANQGSGSGTVTGVTLSGTGFRLSGLPLLPATLAAGQTLRFGIVFAPTQIGSYSGAFRIDLAGMSISGTLAASTNTPNFSVSYTLADGIGHALGDGTVITFPTVDVNGNTTANIDIVNQGPGSGTVTNITLSGSGFRLTGVPVLPATLTAGQTLRVGIVFNPTQAGTFSGVFRVDLTGRSISGTVSASTTTPNFAVSYTLADGVVHPLPDGATINFPAVDINATTTATINVINQGTGSGTVTGIWLAGTGFRMTGGPLLPATVNAGQSLSFGIVFAPTQAGSYNGTFRIDLPSRSVSGTLTASTAPSKMSLGYIEPDTTNTLPLADGATLQFPKTLTGASSSITVLVINTGTGSGAINSITLGGASASAFQLLNLPSLPFSVTPSNQLRFGVRFSPQQQETFSATLVVNVNDQTFTVNLQAQGTGPQFSYTSSDGTNTAQFLAGGTVTIADTSVGQTSSVSITITNNGTGDGVISAISATGQGLSLTEVPTLPLTLHPDASQRFTLNFAPSQPGTITGRLTIGTDTFTVSATAIGSRLIYTYTNAASSVPVTDSGTVIFAPTQVGKSGSLDFSVQNTGTSAATISSINTAAASAVFTLQQLPNLPLSLNPGETISFTVGFAPNNTGSLTATLRINSSSFILSGTGTQPAALPSYQFQTSTSSPQPAQQPTVGLTLAAPYPLALNGTLKLTFIPEVFTDDPAVQFASGGRTVNFTIPANSTHALFNGSTSTMALQTGTIAGNIVVTPSFAMQGGFDMTPASPETLTLTIARSAPQLLSASITAQTLTSFTVVINGYSTPRSMRQLDIQVTPRQGENFSLTHLTIDVNSAASAWFQSTTSQGFGGTFLIAVPFVLQNGSSTDDLVHRLQSLSITATNEIGASNSVSVAIP